MYIKGKSYWRAWYVLCLLRTRGALQELVREVHATLMIMSGFDVAVEHGGASPDLRKRLAPGCSWIETPQPEPLFQAAIMTVLRRFVDILDICILWGQQRCALLAITTQEIPRVIEARSGRGSRTRQSLAIRCLAKCCCYPNFAQRISWNASGCVWKWGTPRKKYSL